MPIKLIAILILMILVSVFTGFNLDNKCNLWLFYTFKDVPVVVTVLISFVLGVAVTLPFTFGKKKAKSEKAEKPEKKVQKQKKDKKSEKDSSESEYKPVPTVSDADAPSSAAPSSEEQ